MEHSLLHAVQLLGLVVTLGGPVLVLALLNPASRILGADPVRETLPRALADSVARWVCWGALAAALAGFVDLLVEAAEVRGQTLFGGVDPALAVRFATTTTVGHLLVARALLLLLAAAAVRAREPWRWWVVAGFGIAAAVCAGLVSHAAAQPTARAAALVAQLTHLGAIAVWMGVLIHLLAARAAIEAATQPVGVALIAALVRRFSPIALTAASLVAASGLYNLWRFLATPDAVLTSAYGLTFVVKLTLMVPLLFAAFTNFRRVRPALLATASGGQAQPALRRFGTMLELEVTAGVLVIAVAGVLGSVSPPGEDGTAKLTQAQVRALLSPDLPTTAVSDPAILYDNPEHTEGDLRYSEFTHNWSGVFVCLMGLCWLAQGAGSRLAGRIWPLLLLPFAGFIAIAADPEVWLLRRIGLAQALRDPQILEHHVGALLVVVLAWLGWRDQRTPAANRPLGIALPVLMIFGSLLLLGHAHSTLSVTTELSNLINVQHAIFGALGLCAGTVRWLDLRGLLPPRAARLVWPSLIVALGLFMAFVYREVV